MFFKTLRGDERLLVARLCKKSRRKGNGRTGWYQPPDGGPRVQCWFDWDRQVFVETGTTNVVLETEPAPVRTESSLAAQLRAMNRLSGSHAVA